MAGGQRKHVELLDRAVALANARRFDEARTLCLQCCRENKDDFEVWFLLGALNGQLGRVEDAIHSCQQAVRLQPENAEASFNLAQAFLLGGRLDRALECYRQALALDPFHPQAAANFIATLRCRSRQPGSRNEQSPESAAAWLEWGNAARLRGNWGEAVACYQEALNVAPDFIGALHNLGRALQDLRRPEEALRYFDKAVAVDPGSADAHFMRANALRDALRLAEAVDGYTTVLAIQPDHLDALHNLGIIRAQQGAVDEAIRLFRQVLERDGTRAVTRSSLLLNLNYRDLAPDDVYREHLAWERHHGSGVDWEPADIAWDPERVLKVGYISPDFRAHSVAFFLEPLLARHDTSRFQVYCYSDVMRPDIVTRRIMPSASVWRDVHPLTDEALTARIRADGIDILVDLAGHTSGNRLGVFARRAAPVQVSWLGYPNTTGLSSMDYRLTDDRADPPGTSDGRHTETLVRLPEGFLCYDPHDDSVSGIEPRADDGAVTFGSFNNLAKVSPEVISVWSSILKAVPDSRLLLKTKPLRDAEVRERVYQEFQAQGVDRERIELTGWAPGRSDHLGLYSSIDIALDTFPYNGTTTTCEALWMGVPVITLAGRSHAGRVGVSLLTQVGMPELIAGDRDHYVALAVALAGDRRRLGALHDGLRSRMAASSLCDAAGFARRVEAAYRSMWRAACAARGSAGHV